MANITRWIPQGFYAMHVGQRKGNYMAGFAGLLLTATGAPSSAMRLLVGGVSAASPLPQATRVRNRGRDGYIATRIFDAPPNDFNIGFEDFDGDLAAMLNTLTIKTLGEWDFVPEGGPTTFQNIACLVQRHAVSAEPDSEGLEGFENTLYLNCSGRIEPGNAEFQAAGTFNLVAQASPVTTTLFGTTVVADHGQQSIYSERWFSEYPCSLVCTIGDGTETDVALPFTPISTAKTKAYDVTTGLALTVSSVNTGTDEATLSAAMINDHAILTIFESSDI